MIGVAAGVASLIIALAITNGMRRDLQEKLVGSTAHVMLMRVAGDGIRDWRPLLERLRTLAACDGGCAGTVRTGADLAGGAEGRSADRGVIPADQKTVSDLLQAVKQGSAEALEPVSSRPASQR